MIPTKTDQQWFDMYFGFGMFADDWELSNAVDFMADKILLEDL